MPRQQGATPVRAGAMHPQAVDQAARTRQFTEQKAMLHTQEKGKNARANLQSQTQRQTTKMQTSAQKQIAAEQNYMEDARRARLVRDKEADRQFTKAQTERINEMQIEGNEAQWAREDAIAKKNRDLLKEATEKERRHKRNKALHNRRQGIIETKIMYELTEQNTKTLEQKEELNLKKDAVAESWTNDKKLGGRFAEQAEENFKAGKHRFIVDPKDIEKASEWKEFSLEGLTIEDANEQMMPGFDGEIDEGLHDKAKENMTVFINEQLTGVTNGVRLGMTTEDISLAIRRGQLSFKDILSAIATLETIQDLIGAEFEGLEVGTAEGEKDFKTQAREASYDAYEEVNSQINKLLRAIDGLEGRGTENTDIYKRAQSAWTNTGPAAEIAEFRRQNKFEPMSHRDELGIIKEIIQQEALKKVDFKGTPEEIADWEEQRYLELGEGGEIYNYFLKQMNEKAKSAGGK